MGRVSNKATDEGPESEIDVGSSLGSYKLEALLGRGGMGRVFRARHVKLDRTVAIKVLHGRLASRPEITKRFFREARVINRINHENIVEVTDFVEEAGLAYCVMEHLEGESLESAVKKEGSLPVARAAAIMIQVCDALQAAHEAGVVHRDLKPDNIFLARRGKEEVVKVLDFGVAKLTEPQAGTNYTVEGTVLGTPAYMSPQQASGLAVDRRADIYSAGVVLYRLLSGKLPFEAPTFAALLAKLTHDAPNPLPRPTPRGETIPARLDQAVMSCLAKSPRDRPQRMRDLGAVLAEVLGSVPVVRRRRKRRLSRRTRLGSVVAAAGVVGLGVAAFWLLRTKEAVKVEKEIADKVASEVPHLPLPPPAPPPPEKITWAVESKPEGAWVTRTDTGEVLGKTPLKAQLSHKKGAELTLKLTLEGFESAQQKVSLGEGGSWNATLKPLPKKPPPHKPIRSKHGA